MSSPEASGVGCRRRGGILRRSRSGSGRRQGLRPAGCTETALGGRRRHLLGHGSRRLAFTGRMLAGSLDQIAVAEVAPARTAATSPAWPMRQ